MRISTFLLEGEYDLSVEDSNNSNDNESVFKVTLGGANLTVTKNEWKHISDTIERSMEFLDEVATYESNY